ncbi:hypothetical protein BCR33DRAFT_712927 [Rhizoclosmatium globosum]|uniref:Uncharacterized protein n=1 Tax=Rhizoclosmatium globosum TaxID=329046 RepID=A0A1Y2CVD9_9FUNG|nr:hypothetical protein BCR33DRAFT_712927 [Rhizoclosmatium globosum]|eukprot:ORY50973.1 hypothetical protein BCR33DRAFT_712927 [Rhizoclosmatium globosum]
MQQERVLQMEQPAGRRELNGRLASCRIGPPQQRRELTQQNRTNETVQHNREQNSRDVQQRERDQRRDFQQREQGDRGQKGEAFQPNDRRQQNRDHQPRDFTNRQDQSRDTQYQNRGSTGEQTSSEHRQEPQVQIITPRRDDSLLVSFEMTPEPETPPLPKRSITKSPEPTPRPFVAQEQVAAPPQQQPAPPVPQFYNAHRGAGGIFEEEDQVDYGDDDDEVEYSLDIGSRAVNGERTRSVLLNLTDGMQEGDGESGVVECEWDGGVGVRVGSVFGVL